jgi:hypothetical protein
MSSGKRVAEANYVYRWTREIIKMIKCYVLGAAVVTNMAMGVEYPDFVRGYGRRYAA